MPVVLQAAGAEAVRLDVYQTAPGSNQAACAVERQLLRSDGIHAIAFSSTAEVHTIVSCINQSAYVLFLGTCHGQSTDNARELKTP